MVDPWLRRRSVRRRKLRRRREEDLVFYSQKRDKFSKLSQISVLALEFFFLGRLER